MKTTSTIRRLRRFIRAGRGVSAVEYAILIGLVASAAAVATLDLQNIVETTHNAVDQKIDQSIANALGGSTP